MCAKFIVVLSSGGGKFAPLLFGLFLMQWFGGGVYASYVVLLNYAAALTAIATLGSAPQILRAGMTTNVNATVVRAALFGVVGMSLMLLLSGIYWAFLSPKPFFWLMASTVGWELKVISLYCFGLLFVSLAHSMLSQVEKWGLLSLSYFVVYWVPLAIGVLSGRVFSSGTVALEVYCLGFFVVSLLSLVFVGLVRRLEVFECLKVLSPKGVVADFIEGIKVSLFGVFLLVGFFAASYYVSLEVGELEAAVYSLSFQLFSISIFIPSVLGSILIPVLSNKEKQAQGVNQKKIVLLYAGISLLVAFAVLVFSPLLLEMYRINSGLSGIVVILLMQLAALLSSVSAYFIQRLVVAGRFGLLATGAALWLCVLICVLTLLNPGVLGLVLGFIVAYLIMNVFYFYSLLF